MSLGDWLFLLSPLGLGALALVARLRPVRWVLPGVMTLSFIGLGWHYLATGDGDGLSSPTLRVFIVHAFGAPLLAGLAIVPDFIGWWERGRAQPLG